MRRATQRTYSRITRPKANQNAGRKLKKTTTSSQPKIVVQQEYRRLSDFIKGQNNFFMFFVPGKHRRRQSPVFKRFAKQFPDLEAELSATITAYFIPAKASPKLQRKLFEAYIKMCQLFYATDKNVIVEKVGPFKGKPHPRYLQR